MRSHNSARPSRWAAAGLLWMASTASALTLSSFQLITSSGTPIACILVYNTVLPSCTTRDFTSGNACSASCAAGIAQVQTSILEACDGVDASSASVLGQALRGNLVNLLCPSRDAPPPSTRTTQIATATTAISTSTTFPRSSSSTTLTTVVSPSTARSRPPGSESPASDLPPPPPPPAAVPTFVQSDRPGQPTGGGSQQAPPQPTKDSTSGGGSPFDTVTRGGAGRSVEVGGWVYAAAAAGLLLWR